MHSQFPHLVLNAGNISKQQAARLLTANSDVRDTGNDITSSRVEPRGASFPLSRTSELVGSSNVPDEQRSFFTYTQGFKGEPPIHSEVIALLLICMSFQNHI